MFARPPQMTWNERHMPMDVRKKKKHFVMYCFIENLHYSSGQITGTSHLLIN